MTFLLGTLLTAAQTAVGSWRSHLAYHNATQCAVAGGKVYVVSDGSLYSYNPDDEFVETYDKATILSDQGIRHIAVDDASGILVIVYNNANIDLLHPDGSVTNITDFANKSTLDPTVNDLRIVDGNAYLATNFGLTILNIERGEFVNTYQLNKTTHSSLQLGGIIYAATTDGLYCGNTTDNLLDGTNWQQLARETYTQLASFDGQLMALQADKSVYRIAPDGQATLQRKGPFSFMHNTRDNLLIGNHTNVFVYDALDKFTLLTLDGTIAHLATDGTTYWAARGAKGLAGYRYDAASKHMQQIVEDIIPNSPIRNHCQYLSFVNDDRLLIAGGCLNYFDETFFDGTLMMYEEGTWTSFQEEGIAQQTGVHYKNMTSIVQDPKDENHHYASSFGQGIYEFRDMQLVAHYTDKNSPLESAIPSSNRFTRISRLQYDRQGNLWISNADGAANVKSPLKILKPDGEMISLYYKELETLPTITEVLFDSRGWVWVVSMRYDVRLFCIDTNGTPYNTADDRVRTFTEKFTDQDGQSSEVYYINDIAEDLNGDLWVLTDRGPYVLYNPSDAFDDNYHFTKIKVPRNDGTNYADYLLDGVYTTCMTIDDADRKWIGTLNNGLYLITGDGLETVHHFTKDNSPLPSNTIESLALHHPSGELYIGTDRGLIAYTTDATRGEVEYDDDKVYAYPNPVTPDYGGLITVAGLKANSHVKITNTAGRLVAEGTSLGGSFTWDGKTPQGQRVSTGIYYVLGCDEEGREGVVTKILFIR